MYCTYIAEVFVTPLSMPPWSDVQLAGPTLPDASIPISEKWT